ncbi:hypothetical protein LI177_02495 [bacterium 210820-DFI.6.37]|nr:hypothetical protein [bacterium 210820-DFI.6.37]
MKLVIFTEAGQQKGMGHYVRMSSVCEACSKIGYKVLMYIDADGKIDKLLLQKEARLYQWTNRTAALKLLSKDTVLIVDSYHVSLDFLKQCKQLVNTLLVVDDNYRLPYQNMNILNPNYFGDSLPYQNNMGNSYYIGKNYTLLRSEFYSAKRTKCCQTVKDVLITFGGTDVLKMTRKVTRYMKTKHRDIALHIVATSAYTDIEEIFSLLDTNDEFLIDVPAIKMCDLMGRVDFAIASAGGTSNELVKMQCPSALMVVADNQILSAEYLEAQGLVRLFDQENLDKIDDMFLFDVRNLMKKHLEMQQSNMSAVDMIINLLRG